MSTYKVRLHYQEGGVPIVLMGVLVPPSALEQFDLENVRGLHIETMVSNSLAKKSAGYANYVVMAIEMKDGSRRVTIPASMRSAYKRWAVSGALISVGGLTLFGLGLPSFGAAALLVGSHVFRTGMSVPHKPYWGQI